MGRAAQVFIISAFLVILFAVPVTQGVMDVTVGGEPYPVALSLLAHPPTEKHLRAFEESLEQSSYFQQKLRPLFQLGRHRLMGELGEKATAGSTPGWYFYTPGIRYLVEPFARPPGPLPEDDPVAVMLDFARQLRMRGVALLVMPVPGKATVHPEHLREGLAPSRSLWRNTRGVLDELRRGGVEVLDLYEVMLAARSAQPGRDLYLRADTHWTCEGARLAAAAVAARVRGMAWFSALPRRRLYAGSPVKVTRPGDVPRMTRIPDFERLFAAETLTCRQVRFASGELQGEPYEEPDEPGEAPVLVLGDSFSRVFERDEPGAAGWIANLALELQTPVSSIVNDGGASTLVRQELARDLDALRGKKLVIWAFVERDLRFGLQGWQPIKL